MDFAGISALRDLLKDCESAASPNCRETLPTKSLQTTRITVPGQKQVTTVDDSEGKCIWSAAEIPSEDALVDVDDKRAIAKYELSYKHDNVGTEDTFLGMSGRSIASSDCTHIVVKVYLPAARTDRIDLDCTRHRIKAASDTHRLFTYLPAPVNHLKAEAKFDPKKSILTATLPILKEEW